MASRICQSLIRKVWRSYADDLNQAPRTEGIYTIGFEHPDGEVEYKYVGHSNNIRRRLQQHREQTSDISEFVQEQFFIDGGLNLRIKWKEEEDGSCVEGLYLDCMTINLGYWPELNRQDGNRCI